MACHCDLAAPPVEVRREVTPRWPVRLPARSAPDGVLRVRGGVLERLLHVEGEPVVVRCAQRGGGPVHFGATAVRREHAEEGIGRLRFALGVDDDLRPFYERFRFDPLIGAGVRARPWLRVLRRPEPFEALAWAVTEQLVDYPRAAAIQRRVVHALGPRCARTGLRDVPSAATLAGQAPARLCGLDLAPKRALALIRAAREVASGRADLRAPDHERAWRRLRAIPEIGPWTLAMLALGGQGRYDQLPAGDVGYLKLVGRLRSGGDPRFAARATEEQVRAFYAPYGEWQGLAAAHSLRAHALRLPARAGTRWSSPSGSAAA